MFGSQPCFSLDGGEGVSLLSDFALVDGLNRALE
jgi:hypothetical protein